jgi:hypothetical protein
MRLSALALSIAALLPIAAAAQTAAPAPAASLAEQEELRFEEAIRNFGFLSGAAYQCLPEADRANHDREVLAAFTGLARLFGTDRAFFYAAAFGAATSMPLDRARCAEYIADFGTAVKSRIRGR